MNDFLEIPVDVRRLQTSKHHAGLYPIPAGERTDTVIFTLNAAGNEGLWYQGGTSLGAGPIRVDTRRIDLSLDSLLFVSTSGFWPSIFSGYRGILGASGQATAAIHIPNQQALVGLRIHTAFVTVDPAAHSGIRSISNTETFTISR